MAKSFKEIERKAETLLEQGHEADKNVQNCKAIVSASNARVAAAYAQLMQASETDEEGNPKGDVQGARAQLVMAQNQLAASQRALDEANRESNRIKQEKNNNISDIQRHNQIEKSNLEKLLELRRDTFGSNAENATKGIVGRINEAENIRVTLLRSMGMEETPEYVSENEITSSGNSWSGGGFSALDVSGIGHRYQGGNTREGFSGTDNVGKTVSTPVGGGLVGLINRMLHPKDDNTVIGGDVSTITQKKYTCREELTDEVDHYACDYQANPENYNDVIRRGETSKDIKKLKKIINSHHIQEDTIFYRRASLDDLGDALSGVPIEQLAGRSYKFRGIMSAGDREMADTVSSKTVVFEIKAAKGTPALDLTAISYFREVMFNEPYCFIESARMEKNNTTHLVIRIGDSDFEIKNVPRTNGRWTGAKGNSKWIPDDEWIPEKHNQGERTWAEIKYEYGFDGIEYINGKPSFSKLARGRVDIDDFSEHRDANFTQADEMEALRRGCNKKEVERWRKEHKYSWHECENCKTMEKIPSIVHGNIFHVGGIAEKKKKMNMEEWLK